MWVVLGLLAPVPSPNCHWYLSWLVQVVEAEPEKLSCCPTLPVEGTVAEQVTEHEVAATLMRPLLLQEVAPAVAVKVHV